MTELKFTLADCILIDLEIEEYDGLMTKADIQELEAWMEDQESKYYYAYEEY